MFQKEVRLQAEAPIGTKMLDAYIVVQHSFELLPLAIIDSTGFIAHVAPRWYVVHIVAQLRRGSKWGCVVAGGASIGCKLSAVELRMSKDDVCSVLAFRIWGNESL
jgi:hypothetical protein